jgi:hypothetical protein
MLYKCADCGQMHEGWPALAFATPHYYHILSPEDKKKIAKINNDLCIIQYPDQTDRFIRTVMKQKIINDCRYVEYGIWVSVSEKSYLDYCKNFDSEEQNATYFCYLANPIPGYEDTLSVKANVITQNGRDRPLVVPQEGQMDNQFVADFYNGITVAEAEQRVKFMMEGIRRFGKQN